MAKPLSRSPKPAAPTGTPHADFTKRLDAAASSLEETNAEPQPQDTAAATVIVASSSASGDGDSLTNGTRLGDFQLLRKLGRGGMGEVFLAKQISLDRRVALKVLAQPLAERRDFVERFYREARTMARLDHPNIVRAYAVAHDRGRHFVAMEYIDGRSLREWLKQVGQLPLGDVVHIALRCAEALAEAHSLQTVHRDVKPDNLMVTRKGVLKITDFGLAKALDEDMSITESGMGFGTPFYMAPEQARSAKHADERSDIYALGCTLYHLLTGALPFEEESVTQLLLRKEQGRFTPVRRIRPDVPERLDLVIDKMMASNPAHRFRSCEELIQQLNPLGLGNQTLSFVGAEKPRRSRPAAEQRTSAAAPADRSAPALPTTVTTRCAADEHWIVQVLGARGKPTLARLSTEQLRRGLKRGTIPLQTRAKRTVREDFRPLAEFPEFARLVQTRVVTERVKSHASEMEDLYAQIDRHERWRHVKRRIRRFFETILGFGSLALWVALIAAGLYGLYLAYPIVMNWLAERLELV